MIPADILRLVPGCERGEAPLAVLPLLRRRVNRNYRVDTHEGSYVVRLAATTDAWLLADRRNEIMLHSAAARSGLAPRLLHADAARAFLIMDYAEGGLWTAAHFADPAHLRDLGDRLHRLHSLDAPPLARIDVLTTLGAYASRLASTAEVVPKLEARLSAASGAWDIVRAAGRTESIVHHDLHATNIVATANGVSFIDWECAVVSDPLLDVACVCAYYPQARDHAGSLLQGAGLDHVRARELDAAIRVFDIHTWLWYRERRERLAVSAEEMAAEQALDDRLRSHDPV